MRLVLLLPLAEDGPSRRGVLEALDPRRVLLPRAGGVLVRERRVECEQCRPRLVVLGGEDDRSADAPESQPDPVVDRLLFLARHDPRPVSASRGLERADYDGTAVLAHDLLRGLAVVERLLTASTASARLSRSDPVAVPDRQLAADGAQERDVDGHCHILSST